MHRCSYNWLLLQLRSGTPGFTNLGKAALLQSRPAPLVQSGSGIFASGHCIQD